MEDLQMKTILLPIFVLMFAFATNASTQNEKIALIKCLRKTINTKRLDQDSLKQTLRLVENYNQYNASELEQECKSNLKKFKQNKKISYKKMRDYTYQLTTQNYTARRVLLMLIENPTRCKAFGIEADFALGLGFGTGAAVGQCQSANGFKWAMLAPKIAIHLGGGVSVLFSKDEFYLPTRGIVDQSSDNIIYTAGFGIAVKQNLDSEIQAVGIGVGIMINGDQSFVLKMIPVGQNFDELINLLSQV